MTAAEYRAMMQKGSPKLKYGNKKTVVDGIAFDSQVEANRYCELKMLLKAGEISDLRLQVHFQLIPKTETEKGVKYIADFAYFQDGVEIIEDTKSAITKKRPEYVIKRKLFKLIYPDKVFREVV